jgi:glycosyltransferase involved in cell wall biosynthesis
VTVSLGSGKTLTVIMPVFNEARTFDTTLRKVLKQRCLGMRKEIIVIESNSTDGTRKKVLKYAVGKPKNVRLRDAGIQGPGPMLQVYRGKTIGENTIRVILEHKPQGKGHALKCGFQEATGDIIIIQDGDTEYKTSEYPKLVKPILEGETDFVLGSRHARGSTWRIREMNETFTAHLINLGHWTYTHLFNLLYGVRLTDPATMFKVFRRSSAKGIHWVSNWFELDWEMVAKLTRAGHKPIEIPVSYESRSTAEGKKIRFLRDGTLVLWAILSFRFRQL